MSRGLLEAEIAGVSVWGPGLEGWAASLPVLAGAAPYEARPSPPPPPAILPATERRRTGPVARLALAVAQEASAMSGLPPASLHGVFGSSNGDSLVVGSILEALTGNPLPATCLGCHDATWAASLLAAMVELSGLGQPVLLCVYDHPPPAPLDVKRPTLAPFAAGLVLAPPGTAASPVARLAVRHVGGEPPDPGEPFTAALRPLARGNSAARSLRLLECLARGQADRHAVPYLDGHLDLAVTPCSTATA